MLGVDTAVRHSWIAGDVGLADTRSVSRINQTRINQTRLRNARTSRYRSMHA